jgi:hypothetical protein
MGQMEPGKGQGIELAVGAWLVRAPTKSTIKFPVGTRCNASMLFPGPVARCVRSCVDGTVAVRMMVRPFVRMGQI